MDGALNGAKFADLREVATANRANLRVLKGGYRYCLAGHGHEFDFESFVLGVAIDDNAEVSSLEAVLRNVAHQNNTVMLFHYAHHYAHKP